MATTPSLDGWADDATHIRGKDDKTLCGLSMDGRIIAFLDEPRPDPGSGCWTCLQQAASIDT